MCFISFLKLSQTHFCPISCLKVVLLEDKKRYFNLKSRPNNQISPNLVTLLPSRYSDDKDFAVESRGQPKKSKEEIKLKVSKDFKTLVETFRKVNSSLG